MLKKPYVLIYDRESERLAMFGDDELILLHCGDCIEVQNIDITSNVDELWQQTRVEADMNGDWYLTGLYKAGDIPIGLAVRSD